MEHIVQFAVGIDDKAIEENVLKNAEKKIIDHIEQDLRNKIFDGGYYRQATAKDPLSDYSKRLIEDFMEKHKEVIINKASDILADRLMRTKRVKEAVNEMVEKGD